jgi:hypothetical protein
VSDGGAKFGPCDVRVVRHSRLRAFLVGNSRRKEGNGVVSVEASGGQVLVGGEAIVSTVAVRIEEPDGSFSVDVFAGGTQPVVTVVGLSIESATALTLAALPPARDVPSTFSTTFFMNRMGGLSGAFFQVGYWFMKLLGGHPSRYMFVWLFSCAAMPVVFAMASLRVVVGRDAVAFRWLGIRWYVPLGRITRLELEKNVLKLGLGGRRTLSLGWRGNASVPPAILHRIQSGLEARPDAVDAAEELVAQGDRSRADWHEALRALRVRGYRDAPIDDQRLWSILEHPRASLSARIGAASVLASSLDTEGKQRLRHFAVGCVMPDLRRELESIADRDPLTAVAPRLTPALRVATEAQPDDASRGRYAPAPDGEAEPHHVADVAARSTRGT